MREESGAPNKVAKGVARHALIGAHLARFLS